MEKVVAEAEELPKAIVRRVVKDKLSQCHKGDGDLIVHKEAILAFSESSRIFIHYLSATANDICREKKRQTISGDDVLKALEEIEFPEFIKPLEDLRPKNPGKGAGKNEGKNATKNAGRSGGKNAGKNAGTSKTKEVKKKRKLEESSSRKQGGKDEDNQDEDGSGDE
ncbi:DNA polymerase epsilon subunit 3 [Pyrus ussuriensis x Pyrus communis]|uniref:DNA polymerase epsilon subunit 3 n=1 Tax=Pyrus ussuriensis x Pyrus communis TaxID=2448454 RepID=A0A5N5FTL2_9ROSA|nr:DNA polymerase epsilon subunit 3 [Pyrus x bretschneideri]KAB2606476.1 DNA polymerase epsilon subunit 3 [Pyrus ussuriensis x Pyrus communis]